MSNHASDAVVIEPVSDGEPLVSKTVPVDPLDPTRNADGSDVVPTDIGIGKPLSIQIMSMYAGPDRHRKLLVSSAVKSVATYDAQPTAMHYVFDRPETQGPLRPRSSQAGSPIVYYSPAALDTSLDVEIRFAFDDFDLDQAERWLEVASKAAKLPVFALTTTLGGLGGAAAGKSALYFAENAVRIALGAIDRWYDNDNDWVSTWTLSLDPLSGRRRARAGYVLFYGDNDYAEVVKPLDLDFDEADPQPWNEAYRVDTRTAQLVYVDDPKTVVADDQSYVLTYVNGAEQPALEGWKAAAVSTALAQKFLNVDPDQGLVSDLGSLLEGYNDLTMARRYAEAGELAARRGTTSKRRAELKLEQERLLKNIQSADVRDIVSPPK